MQRVRDIGEPWLTRVTQRLADMAGCGEAVAAALASQHTGQPPRYSADNIAAAIGATGAYAWRSVAEHGAASALRSATSSIQTWLRDALAESGVARVALLAGDVWDNRVVGARWYDLALYLLARIAHRELAATAEALWTLHRPLVAGAADADWRADLHVVQPILEDLARKYADALLAHVAGDAADVAMQMEMAYLGDTTVAVSIPVRSASSSVSVSNGRQ